MFTRISRADVNRRYKPNNERAVALCVITTLDDQVLMRAEGYPFTTPRYRIKDITAAEQEIARDFEAISSLRAIGSVSLQNLVDVISFLGAYCPQPPSRTRVLLPFAVELEMEAGQLEIQGPTNLWVSFDAAEERLDSVVNSIVADPDEPYCVAALQLYFDRMTDLE